MADEAKVPDVRAKVEAAEVKLRKLLDKRNELNQIAREGRASRDGLHDARRLVLDSVAELRAKRDAFNDDARLARARRDEHQAKARALVEAKRGARGKLPSDARARLHYLQREAQRMEMEHATHPMSVEKEREFLDKLRAITREANELHTVVDEGSRIEAEITDIDAEIDRLFKDADEEHRKVVELSNAAQALHQQLEPAYHEASAIRARADELHAKVVEAQERANAYHAKAVALIDELEQIRGSSRKERDEERAVLSEHRKQVTEALAPDDEFFDDVLDKLKSTGKISL